MAAHDNEDKYLLCLKLNINIWAGSIVLEIIQSVLSKNVIMNISYHFDLLLFSPSFTFYQYYFMIEFLLGYH